MTVMSDVTVGSSQEDKCLDDVPKLDENPWAVTPGPSGYNMDPIPDSSVFSEMPCLENQEPTLSMPCSSPVGGTFFGPEPAPLAMHFMKDIKDPDAEKGRAGLHNMGNTCFMNAGLQCLLCNPQLVRHLIEDFELTEEIKLTLTGSFTNLLKKVWSGQFSIVHPLEFKDTLSMYHPQFKDYRQHDCQEFLALLLDSLHEQLNFGQFHNKPFGIELHNNASAKVEDASAESEDVVMTKEIENKTVNTLAEPSASDTAQPDMSIPLCFSEDSNQSEPSHLSVDSSASGDCSHRMEPIPDNLKTFSTRSAEPAYSSPGEISEACTVEMADSCTQGESVSQPPTEGEPMETMEETDARRLPSIEDLYMKDTKTLNTNVLASEFEHDIVSTDSEKFHKPDNTNRPETVEEVVSSYEQLNDLLTYKPNNDSPCKPVKDTNLLVNVKDKFTEEFYSKKCLFSELENTEDNFGINNIKRMKVDDGEKNIRMQEKMKVNIDKNIVVPKSANQQEETFANVRHDLPITTEQPFSLVAEGDQQISQEQRLVAQGNALNNEDQLRVKYIRDAQRAWDEYKQKNKSVIVDTFQGQFKSTVICSECSHISVTFEPFMYLSVPLPHAMERQISVILVPCDNKQPIEYLLTLNKQDTVKKLKLELLRLIGEETCDIMVAEVLDNHIARILEDNTMLRFVNDSSRNIYAFEMIPAPQIDDDKDLSGSGGAAVDSSTGFLSDTPNNALTSDGVVSSTVNSVGLQSGGAVVCRSTENPVAPIDITPFLSSASGSADKTVSSTTGSDQLNNSMDGRSSTWTESLELREDVDWQRNLLSSTTTGESEAPKDEQNYREPDTSNAAPKVESDKKDDAQISDNETEAGDDNGTQADQWKSCAICLEEMVDSDLMVHTSCGGTLCQSCLEMSFKHYGESTFVCPVCSTPVNPTEDFIQLNCMDDYKPKTRILSVPIIHRLDYEENGEKKMKLFGHPNIMYLASHMGGDFLYSSVDRVVACPGNYSIILTDGQGYRCSRCMFTAHCSGCEVPRDGPVSLQPGDHLTVTFPNLDDSHLDSAGRHVQHSSMDRRRPNVPLTLFDCFEAFTESELLDEHNPWYCPRCKKNQCAKKTMTVWKYPETLVVYLKRFVFHELSSTKIDAKVEFPLEGLDLSAYISGPNVSDLQYDLQSCVCHFGGSNSGHYTCYAKHPLTSNWFYYNDENLLDQRPREEDYSNAYILFYQRRGANVPIRIPEKLWSGEGEKTEALVSYPGVESIPGQSCTLNQSSVTEMLEQFQETQSSQAKSDENTEPDTTVYEFYE